MKVRPWWLLPTGRIHGGWWIGLSALLLWMEHVRAPAIGFPLLYALPVILAAWYSDKRTAVGLAVAFPLLRFFFVVWPQTHPADLVSASLAALFRGIVILAIGLWFARLADYERDLSRHVRVLEGLLPICSFCKNIRNENGTWERLESFISRRSEAEFSHGVCPTCGKAHYPDIMGAEESVTTR